MAQAVPFDSAAARRYHLPFGVVLVVAGLLQLALFAYATAPGLAGTGDSRYYLHAAQTLRTAGQLLNPDGTPYRYWPPLYPVLLAAAGTSASVCLLHAASLLGSLLLWSWLGRQLLPKRGALVLPVLLALSTPWLLVGRFVWAEAVFLLLFAAYVAALWQWLRTERWAWWMVVTVIGLLLPLQRTLGLFLLAGIGAGLLLGIGRRRLASRGWWAMLLHLAISVLGGVLWQWYALLMAGLSRYHPSRGVGQLLSSAADYGFVLGRWLLPLPTSGRVLLPSVIWAAGLLGLLWALWPRRQQAGAIKMPMTAVLNAATASAEASAAHSKPQPVGSSHCMRQLLWSASLTLIVLVAVLTVFAQSAAGIHDAERYASVLYAPIVLLVLAAWPARAPRWLGVALLSIWVLGAALRVGRVAHDLRAVPPLPASLFADPGPHGQRVGAAGE